MDVSYTRINHNSQIFQRIIISKQPPNISCFNLTLEKIAGAIQAMPVKPKIRHILSSIFLLATSLACQSGSSPKQILTLYGQPLTNTSQSVAPFNFKRTGLVERFHSGQFGGSEKYTALARLQLKVQPDQQRIIYPIPLPEEILLNSGWNQKHRLILWQPGNAPPTPVAIPLNVGANTPLEDHSHFELDFTSLPSLPTCLTGLQLTVGQGDNLQILNSANAGLLQETLTLNPTLIPWTEKGIGYLLRRYLNLVEDERWYYAQNEQNVVIQRRLDQDISADEALELILAPGNTLDLINLRVTVEPSGTSQLLLNEQLKPRTPLTDGRNGWRINLRQALRNAFPQEVAENAQKVGQHRFHLREIFTFVPGQAQTIAASQPIRRVTLLGGATNLQLSLPLHETKTSANQHHLSVDLSALQKLPDTTPQQVQLWLTPPDNNTPCVIRLDRARFTGIRERRLPLFASPLIESLQRWGGPFLEIPLNDEQIEAPRDVAYLDFPYGFTSGKEALPGVLNKNQGPLTNLSSPVQAQQSKIKTIQYKRPEDRTFSLPSRSSLTPILWSSQGATFFASGERLPNFSIDNGNMALKGQGGELRLDWPMDVPIEPESRLFFSMPSGAKYIERADLSIDLANGKKINYRFTPNQPLRLDSPAEHARRLSLYLVMKGPYHITLREAALFTPSAQDFRQAYRLPRIKSVILDPIPQINNDYNLVTKPGQVSGLLTPGNDPLYWSTPLKPVMTLFRGIHLNYRLPRSDNTGCRLEIQVIGTRASRQFQVCLPDEEGYLFLPFASLANGSPLELGTVTALEWRLRPPLKDQKDDSGITIAEDNFFSLRFIAEGFAEQSAEQQIADTAVFKLDGKPVFLAPDTSSTEENTLFRQWRTLPDDVFRKFLDNQGFITDSDHPWFFVDRIVAEPKTPLPLEQWLELNKPPPSPPAPSRWPKIITILISIAMLGLGWRLGWWRYTWRQLALIASRSRARLITSILYFSHYLIAATTRIVGWRHLIVLCLSCMAFWQVGRWGFDNPRSSVLGIAAVLASVLAWQRWHRDKDPLSTQVTSLLGVGTLGVIPWWLGYKESSGDTIWILAPLASSLYWQEAKAAAMLNWLRQNTQLTINLFRLSAWIGLTAFLYWRGLISPLTSGENYYFTFGGMAAVLALRALLLTIKPLVRRWLPSLAESIYDAAGSLYFSAALMALVATALTLALKNEALAEQLAIIVYYNLVVGTVKEIIALRRQSMTTEAKQNTSIIDQ